MSVTNQYHYLGLNWTRDTGGFFVLSCPLRCLIKEKTCTLRTKPINMSAQRRPRPWAMRDFDLPLSGHETLVNFDLLLASEHKAFVHATQIMCPLNHCLVQYGDIVVSVKIIECCGSLSTRVVFLLPVAGCYCGL